MNAATPLLHEEGYKLVGYLINFGHKNTLEWKRFILTDQKD